jgi:hypothetical protein
MFSAVHNAIHTPGAFDNHTKSVIDTHLPQDLPNRHQILTGLDDVLWGENEQYGTFNDTLALIDAAKKGPEALSKEVSAIDVSDKREGIISGLGNIAKAVGTIPKGWTADDDEYFGLDLLKKKN